MRWALYAMALAVLATGLQWAGVPALTLLAVGLASVCLFLILLAIGGTSHGRRTGRSA